MTTTSGIIAEALCHGSLTIDGLEMNRPAWACLNLYVLMEQAETRGEDILIPNRAGRMPTKRYADTTKHQIEFLVVGDRDRFGNLVPFDERQDQLYDNVEWLNLFVFSPVASLDGTRTLILTQPNGRTRTGQAHVGPLRLGATIAGSFTATFEVSIPAGQLGPPTAP